MKLLIIIITFVSFLIFYFTLHTDNSDPHKFVELDVVKKVVDFTDEEKTVFINRKKDCGFYEWNPNIIWANSVEFLSGSLWKDKCFLKFTVNYLDDINWWTRSEFDKDFEDNYWSDVWYSWDVYIPNNYKDVTLKNEIDWISNWQIIWQWHNKPDESIWEVWDELTEQSPPISIEYNYLSLGDPEYKKLVVSWRIFELNGYTSWLDKTSILWLTYWIPPETIAIVPIKKWEWINLVFNIKWSKDNFWFIELLVNDESVTKGKFYWANMYNKISNYLKIWIYRNPNIKSSNSVYFSQVKHWNSRFSVTKE